MNLLPRSTPEAQGASSAGIRAAIEALDALGGIHGVLVLRGGSVIAETWWQPYEPQHQQLLFSVSKSVTSTAVGLAIADGLFDLDSRVIDILAEDAPADPDENLAALTVRHLLTMTTGHAAELMESLDRSEGSWVRTMLAEPVQHAPGSVFLYNTGATYLLSAIVQKTTGQTLTQYLEPRLFAPLGITGARWESSPEGIDVGGFGLRILLEDVALFGQLYLQHGQWNGAQLVPAEWIAEATGFRVPSVGEVVHWTSGYGYQFWQNRDGSYRADGAFGQYCIVLDELDAVIALTAGVTDTGMVLDAVFDSLVPALSAGVAAAEIPSTLHTPPPTASARAYSQQYYFPTNPLRIATAGIVDSVLTIDGSSIPFGSGEWATGGSYRIEDVLEPVAASGGWVDDVHFVIELRAIETPYVLTISIELDGDTVDLRIAQNVALGPVPSWRLVGGISSGA